MAAPRCCLYICGVGDLGADDGPNDCSRVTEIRFLLTVISVRSLKFVSLSRRGNETVFL